MQELHAQLREEREDCGENRRYGLLGMLAYFVEHNHAPDLVAQLSHMKASWLPARSAQVSAAGGPLEAELALKRVSTFVTDVEAETKGTR